MSALDNWTEGNNAMVTADEEPYPIWDTWGSSQRDLFILDHEGIEIYHINISDENISDALFNENELYDMVVELIDSIPILGDINEDDVTNIVDVVLLVNYILSPSGGSDCEICDLNSDGVVNIIDVIILVNIILTP